ADVVEAARETQVLLHGQVIEQPGLVRHERELPLGADRIAIEVPAPDADRAARGSHDADETAQRRRLASSVGADEAQHLPRGDLDGARPSEIASHLGVSRAAATTFIQRLESKALVETTPDPDDDRGVRVALTRHGLDVLLRCGQLERRLAARTIEGLPASALQRAVHLLEEFRHRLAERTIEIVR